MNIQDLKLGSHYSNDDICSAPPKGQVFTFALYAS